MKGIYRIYNRTTIQARIVASEDVFKDMEKDFDCLNNNCHENKALQSDYNKYGYTGFDITIEHICHSDDLSKAYKNLLDDLRLDEDNSY
jgi:hypothetical protein